MTWAKTRETGSVSIMFGYIDSGTGGLILQMLLGGIAGLGIFVKMRWQSIKARFSRQSDSAG